MEWNFLVVTKRLSPINISILTLDDCPDICQCWSQLFLVAGERMGKLIRGAEKAKIPVMCVVGEREAESGQLSVRTHANGDVGNLSVDDVIAKIVHATNARVPFD